MGYIFDDWKELLENFHSNMEKDLEAIHQQKVELQQIRTDIFNRFDSGAFYHDDQRVVISAPEIVIGNVDKSGTLQGTGMGRVIIKGIDVELEGVSEAGHIISRAPSIRQVAVDPGIDGVENVVCSTSEVVAQAGDIVLHSSDAQDAFSQTPVPAGRGGVRIHADKSMSLESAVSAETRKQEIENTVSSLSKKSSQLKTDIAAQKKIVDDCFKKMSKILDEEDKLNQDKDYLVRVNMVDIDELHEQMDLLMPSLYQATQTYMSLMSEMAETTRAKKALETEKGTIKTGDEFKNNTTGASLSVVAETISVETTDGDGNLHTNPGAGIHVRTPQMVVAMADDQGKLVKDGGLDIHAQSFSFSSIGGTGDAKDLPAEGNFTVMSKDIHMEAIDYQGDDKGAKEKELTKEGKISLMAKTIEVAATNPQNIERDDKGALTKGEYKAEGDVIIKSKNLTVESLDYEVKDGKLEAKALTKDGKVSIRAEKTDILAADTEGKATGSITMNAKAVSVKSMDVDKEKLTDSALAAGSTMTLVSEKMYVGAKSKDVKSKKLQAVSEEVGLFADKTLEAQQGDGKAVVQLDGGNASVGGSKTQVYGATTVNAKLEVKDEVKAPKATIDNLEAKSSFKSSNISDGIAVPGAGGGGSLSAKLKSEDVPKE